MTTTLDLTRLPPAKLRILVALCAEALYPDAAAVALRTKLREDTDWLPTPADSPLPWARVETWLAAKRQDRLRQWLETHVQEEEHDETRTPHSRRQVRVPLRRALSWVRTRRHCQEAV